jgi:Xaa-Pro aminopeptidase
LADFDENSCIGIVEGAKPLKEILHRQRLIKSPLEQKLMQKAGKVGADAFRETMRWSKGCNRESSLAAKMEFEAKLGGASGLAYVPVVAGGDRANIIHYVRNDRLIENNSMVLMDAGAKVHGYCSDITRTWPISGKFTPAQRELYEAVLRTQQRCIQAVFQWPQFPDISLNDLNSVATVLFMDELGALGFTNPEKCVHKLFPHSIGHYIGLDLHDCPSISYDEKLKSGMAITIEPGLYVPADEQYPTRFHGIGIRIEDDLILSDTGCINMTAGVPREVEEIEDLLNKAL